MSAVKPQTPPAARPAPASPVQRRTLALPVPSSLELIAAGIVLAVLIGGGIALYAKGHADGYADASAVYQKLMAEQAAANKAAVDAANAILIQQAADIDKKDRDLDAANAAIDAGSGGADATELGLDAARMKALNTIR